MWGRTPTYKRESLRHTKEVGTITIQEGCASDLQGGGGRHQHTRRGSPRYTGGRNCHTRGGASDIQRGEPPHRRGCFRYTRGTPPPFKSGPFRRSKWGGGIIILERGISDIQYRGDSPLYMRGHLRHTKGVGVPSPYKRGNIRHKRIGRQTIKEG